MTYFMKKRNLALVIFFSFFASIFVYYQLSYRQVNIYFVDDNINEDIKQSVFSLRKELLKTRLLFTKPIDMYVANFSSSSSNPEILHKQHLNIIWLGSTYNPIDFNKMRAFDFILVSTKELYNFFQNQGIKTYLFPVFIANKKNNIKKPNFIGIIGNPPHVVEMLTKHHLPYKKYDIEKKSQEILNNIPYFKMVFVDNTNISSQSLDINPLFLKLAYNRVPLATYWKYPDTSEAINLFDDRINFYIYPSDIITLLNNYDSIDTRIFDAETLIEDNFSVKAATSNLLHIINHQDSLFSNVKKKSINISLPISVGHVSAGDYWLAKDLLTKFNKNGWLGSLSYFNSPFTYKSEVNIILRGAIDDVESYLSGDINILYLAYATEDIILKYDEYVNRLKSLLDSQHIDAIAVSSYSLYLALKNKNIDVYYVPQFTNSSRFYPNYDENKKSEVLFVGNNFPYRTSAINVYNANLPISIYGDYWPEGMAKNKYIDNRILRKYYSSAKIVLNDAREGTKKSGFIINRIFDATACGSLVISDYMKEIEDIYGDSVPMWKTKEELISLVKYYLDPKNEKERKEKAERARQITLNNFTLEIVSQICNKLLKNN